MGERAVSSGPTNPIVVGAFYLFLISIPFEAILYATGYFVSGTSGWSLSRLSGVLFLFSTLLEMKRIFACPSRASKWLLLYLFIYIMSAMSFGSREMSTGLSAYLSMPFMIVLFLACSGVWRDSKIQTKGLLILMLTLGVVAALQLAGLSYSSHNLSSYNSSEMREAAFGDDPNFRGAQHATGLIIGALVIAGAIPAKKGMRGAAWVSAVVCCAALIQTGSRGAVISCFLALTALWLNKLGKVRRLKMTMVAVVAVAALIGFVITSEGIRERFTKTIRNEDTANRALIYKESLDQFAMHPFLGLGPYRNLKFIGSAFGSAYTDTHNTFLWVLTANGLIGFLPFFLAIAYCLLMAWRQRSLNEGAVALALCVMAVSFSQTTSWHYEKLFWVLLALGSALSPFSTSLTWPVVHGQRRPGLRRGNNGAEMSPTVLGGQSKHGT